MGAYRSSPFSHSEWANHTGRPVVGWTVSSGDDPHVARGCDDGGLCPSGSSGKVNEVERIEGGGESGSDEEEVLSHRCEEREE